jgi:hypothetical protein
VCRRFGGPSGCCGLPNTIASQLKLLEQGQLEQAKTSEAIAEAMESRVAELTERIGNVGPEQIFAERDSHPGWVPHGLLGGPTDFRF